MRISILYLTALLIYFLGNFKYIKLINKVLNTNYYPIEIDTNKIRFDGIYNTFDTSILRCGEKSNEKYVTDDFIVFFKNNKVYFDNTVTMDNFAFRKDYYNRLTLEDIGIFYILQDSIFAKLPTHYYKRGQNLSKVTANFKGYIKNSDTILNWKMVPPFPKKVNPKWNELFMQNKVPKTLYFIKNDAIRKLDSLVYK